MPTPDDYRIATSRDNGIGPAWLRCKRPGCKRAAFRTTGYCKSCTETMRKARSSDGVRAGPKRKLTDEQVEIARRMRSAFKSDLEIAELFGVHADTIRANLKRLKRLKRRTEAEHAEARAVEEGVKKLMKLRDG